MVDWWLIYTSLDPKLRSSVISKWLQQPAPVKTYVTSALTDAFESQWQPTHPYEEDAWFPLYVAEMRAQGKEIPKPTPISAENQIHGMGVLSLTEYFEGLGQMPCYLGHAGPEWLKVESLKLESADQIKLATFVKDHATNDELVFTWSNLPIRAQFPELTQTLIAEADSFRGRILAQRFFADENGKGKPEELLALIKRGIASDSLAEEVLSQPRWSRFPKLVKEYVVHHGFTSSLQRAVFSNPQWGNDPNHFSVLREILSMKKYYAPVSRFYGEHPEAANFGILEILIRAGASVDPEGNALQAELINKILKSPHWSQNPELLRLIPSGVVDLTTFATLMTSGSAWDSLLKEEGTLQFQPNGFFGEGSCAQLRSH